MLSYSIEYSLVGLKPFLYHLDNLLLHTANTVLVFMIIYSLSENIFVALLTALFWGLHPMKVESLAWIAERKDVLYSFFFLGSLWTYMKYLKENMARKYYLISMLFFFLSILSKAQAVVLPVTFFVVDYFLGRKFERKIFIEKIPFFVFSLVFGLIAIRIQKSSGAVQDYVYFPAFERILFSLYAFANYLLKLVLPHSLSCFYPYPEKNDQINSIWVYLSPLVLILFIFFNYIFRKKKAIISGSLFFVLTILPVLQFIPVGDAIMADRYAYIPSIGIFFILAFFLHSFILKTKFKSLIYTLTFVLLCFYSGNSFSRAGIWKDSISLYSDALKNYPEIPIIRNNRGAAYSDKKMYERALLDFDTLVILKPRFPSAYSNRALTYEKLEKYKEALQDFNNAIKIKPNEVNDYLGAGRMHIAMKNPEEAIKILSKFLVIDSNNKNVIFSRGEAYASAGNYNAAISDFNKYILIDPSFVNAYNDRGILYIYLNQKNEAIADFTKAIQLDPNKGNSYYNRSLVYNETKEFGKALEDAIKAKQAGHAVTDAYIEKLRNQK